MVGICDDEPKSILRPGIIQTPCARGGSFKPQLVPCWGLQQVKCDVSLLYTKFLGVSREIELAALAWVTGLGSSSLLRFLPLF